MCFSRTLTVKDPAELGLNDLNFDGSAFVTVSATIFCAAAESTPSLALAASLNLATAFWTS